MSKSKTTRAANGAAPSDAPPAAGAGGAQATRFRVALLCPTPLEHPELDLDAANEKEAWQKFCAANGISDSDHPKTITAL